MVLGMEQLEIGIRAFGAVFTASDYLLVGLGDEEMRGVRKAVGAWGGYLGWPARIPGGASIG